VLPHEAENKLTPPSDCRSAAKAVFISNDETLTF